VASVEEAEALAVAVSRQVAEVIVTAGVAQTAGEASYEGGSIACACGRRAAFHGYRSRWVVTRAGAVRVARAYYYCRRCRQGQTPWDRPQGLAGHQWTPAVKSLVANFCARLTYAEAVELLELGTGLRVEEFSAEQIVAQVGQQLRQRQAQEQALALAGETPARLRPAPGRLYVGLDGTSAHIEGAWHEVKTAVIYAAEPDAEGLDEARDCHYLAAQAPAEQFGAQAWAAAVQQGLEQAGETVVIGDGAEWIWNLAGEHYPQATQIVDYWHACEHIWELRRALYPEGSGAGERWAQEHCRRLQEQGPASLVRALARLRPTSVPAQEAVRAELGYSASTGIACAIRNTGRGG